MIPDVYEVKARVTIDGDNEESYDRNVLARNAEEAVAKTRNVAMSDKWTWEDDDGKKHTSRHTSFKLIAVNRVCEVDIK